MTETAYFTTSITVTMTPTMKQRLERFADERGWHVSATARYFVEDGLDSEVRRAELAEEAKNCWPPKV